MGLLIHPEITLDCGLSPGAWLPKTIHDFLSDVARIDDVSERIMKLQDYVHRLQDEMNKIDPFRKELPLTMILLGDVISTVKEELSQYQKSKAEPILEEFIPLKKNRNDEEKKESDAVNGNDKMKWMSSVQLWSSDVQNHPTTDHLTNYKLSPKKLHNNNKRKEAAVSHPTADDLFPSGKNRTAGRTFEPLKGCVTSPVAVMVIGKDEFSGLPALSLGTPEIKDSKEEVMHSSGLRSKSSSTKSVSLPASNVQQQSARKQRRCWSPELHRIFVNALQQLGGSQAATPKQIRELMQVDGLTNDEVKSHLQKYRLHTRKLAPTEQPVLLGFGGLWMSRQNCGESSRGNSTSAGNSGVEEEEDDDKSESHMSGKDDV